MRDGIVAEFDGPDGFERAYLRLQALGYTRLRLVDAIPGARRRDPPAGVGRAVDHAGRGADRRVSRVPRAVVVQRARLPASMSAAARSIRSRRTSRSRSSRACSPRRWRGFCRSSGYRGCLAFIIPIFEVDGFERASVDRFWIGVDASDPRFDERVGEVLEASGALRCRRIGGAIAPAKSEVQP